MSGVNVRNLDKIQDKWLLFQRFVTSVVALEFHLTTYLTAFTTLRKECCPEIDRLFLIRLTSSSPLKITASRKYKFAAYKLLFL